MQSVMTMMMSNVFCARLVDRKSASTCSPDRAFSSFAGISVHFYVVQKRPLADFVALKSCNVRSGHVMHARGNQNTSDDLGVAETE